MVLDFFGLWDEGDGFGHGDHGDLSEKLGGEMRESLRVEAAGAGLSEQIRAQHESAIGERHGRGDMERVAVLRLDRAERGGLLGRQDDGEIAGGLVADGLGDEVGEGHGMAAARAVMRLDTRLSRRARLSDSPME